MQPVRSTQPVPPADSIVDYVASILCARIASGEVERDELTQLERAFSRDLRVSRTTVRAAIQLLHTLETDGDTERLAAVLSSTADLSSVAEVQNWRRMLLARIVREAVQTATADDLDALTRFADKFEAISFREPVKLLVADLAFHQRLAMASYGSML